METGAPGDAEARLRKSQERARIMMVQTALDGRFTQVPERFCDLLGYPESELLRMRSQDITHPEDGAVDADWARRLIVRESDSLEVEKRYVRKDGRPIWVYINASLVVDERDRPLSFLIYIRDITKHKRVDERLRLAARVMESATDAIVVADKSGRIMVTNHAFESISGFTEEEVIGRPMNFMSEGLHPSEFLAGIARSIRDKGSWHGEMLRRRKDGTIYPELVDFSAVHEERGEVSHWIAIGRDFSEIKAAQLRLEQQASTDALTGLPNRSLFYDRLHHGLAKARRNHHLVAIMFIDLDDFKVINDSFGHEAGDQMLREMASRLQAIVRNEDTVARLGGDEFTVILEEVASPVVVSETAERINHTLFAPMQLAGHPVQVSGSVGISLYPEDGKSVHDLLRHADAAMYAAKVAGRNSYCFYGEQVAGERANLIGRERRLRRAVERDEFEVHYQPQVELASGRVCGIQALLRWQDAERGLLPASLFIPLAESSGLIERLTDRLLDAAIAQVRAWQDEGMEVPRLALHLSRRQLQQADLAQNLDRHLRNSGVDAAHVDLELPMGAIGERGADVPERVVQLRNRGYGLTVDDFGMGSSSLQLLRRCPIQRIKIDRKFFGDSIYLDDEGFAHAIINLGHALGAGVVVKRVETEAQAALLQRHGCDVAQGFFFSRPMPADAVRSYLNRAPGAGA